MILNSAIDSRLGVDSSVMFEPTSTSDTPSTSQLTALRRPPLIEMLTAREPDADLVGQVARDARRQRGELDEVAVVERHQLEPPHA
jgi:hypothetical protein